MERCPVSVASVVIMVAVVAVFGAEGPGAVGPVSRLVWWTRRAGSGGRCCERFELFERGEEIGGPGPAVVEAQFGAAAVQQPVAQPFGFGVGEVAVEHQRLGPDDQVVREHDDLEPHLVERGFPERKLGQSGVLVAADAVLDVGVLAVAALERRDVLIVLGEDRLESGSRHDRSSKAARHGAGARPARSGWILRASRRSPRLVICATSPLSRRDRSCGACQAR